MPTSLREHQGQKGSRGLKGCCGAITYIFSTSHCPQKWALAPALPVWIRTHDAAATLSLHTGRAITPRTRTSQGPPPHADVASGTSGAERISRSQGVLRSDHVYIQHIKLSSEVG